MKNENKAIARSKYAEVSELGSRHNLSFSSQLVLGHLIMALDGVRKSLLVMETNKETDHSFVIELRNISTVTVRKSYGSIHQGALKSKGIEEFLKRIDLQFKLKNKDEKILLPFYDRETNDKSDRNKLERYARNWQMILSKMIGTHAVSKLI